MYTHYTGFLEVLENVVVNSHNATGLPLEKGCLTTASVNACEAAAKYLNQKPGE